MQIRKDTDLAQIMTQGVLYWNYGMLVVTTACWKKIVSMANKVAVLVVTVVYESCMSSSPKDSGYYGRLYVEQC